MKQPDSDLTRSGPRCAELSPIEQTLIEHANFLLTQARSWAADDGKSDRTRACAKDHGMSVEKYVRYELGHALVACTTICELGDMPNSGLSARAIAALRHVMDELSNLSSQSPSAQQRRDVSAGVRYHPFDPSHRPDRAARLAKIAGCLVEAAEAPTDGPWTPLGRPSTKGRSLMRLPPEMRVYCPVCNGDITIDEPNPDELDPDNETFESQCRHCQADVIWQWGHESWHVTESQDPR